MIYKTHNYLYQHLFTPLSHSPGGKCLVSGDRKQTRKLSGDNEIRVFSLGMLNSIVLAINIKWGWAVFTLKYYIGDTIYFDFSVGIGNFPAGTKFHAKFSNGEGTIFGPIFPVGGGSHRICMIQGCLFYYTQKFTSYISTANKNLNLIGLTSISFICYNL